MLDQDVVFRVVPEIFRDQSLVWSVVTEPDKPVPEHHNVFIIIILNLVQWMNNEWSAEAVRVLALSRR